MIIRLGCGSAVCNLKPSKSNSLFTEPFRLVLLVVSLPVNLLLWHPGVTSRILSLSPAALFPSCLC